VLLLAAAPQDRRLARAALLLSGLALYGISDGFLILAGLGLDPWDVLHQGLSRVTGLQVGTCAILVGALVLLGWIPLRQRPGVGTFCNVVVIGLAINATLDVVPAPHAPALQVALLVIAVLLNGVATGAYIGAGLGPGPRDGLSTGIASRGVPLRRVRTVVELSVLAVGWLLGGTVGVGTVVYAAAIGPLMHVTVPAFRLRPVTSTTTADEKGSAAAPTPKLGRRWPCPGPGLDRDDHG
jgi:uncharacterized membrane protein YczE